jgi:hypothetical protein
MMMPGQCWCVSYIASVIWLCGEKSFWEPKLRKFSALCGTPRLITTVTRSRHWVLFWTRWIHCTTSYHISLRSTSHLPLVSDVVPDVPTKIYHEFLIFPAHAIGPAHPPSFDRVYYILLMSLSPFALHFVLLGAKCSARNFVPEHDRYIYVAPLMWETKFYIHIKRQVKLQFCRPAC